VSIWTMLRLSFFLALPAVGLTRLLASASRFLLLLASSCFFLLLVVLVVLVVLVLLVLLVRIPLLYGRWLCCVASTELDNFCTQHRLGLLHSHLLRARGCCGT